MLGLLEAKALELLFAAAGKAASSTVTVHNVNVGAFGRGVHAYAHANGVVAP